MKFYDFIEYLNEDKKLVYKHPCEDFNTSTKIIVREGQKALFIKNGKLADILEPGRHKLQTESLPILRKIMAIPTGGMSTFSAEIYFVSVVDSFNFGWGTLNQMDLQDPVYHIVCKVGASGEATFRIIDVEPFFKKIIGTTSSFEVEELQKYFRSLVNMHIKNAISTAITRRKISLLEINSNLVELSNDVTGELNNILDEYGLLLRNFSIENVVIPDDDESINKLKVTLNKKADMEILGYSYKDERGFDVMEKAVSNEGAGGLQSSLMGLGIGFGMAGGIAGGVRDIQSGLSNTDMIKCLGCGSEIKKDSKFCPNCGQKINRFCPKCGAEVSGAFCSNCGEKIL